MKGASAVPCTGDFTGLHATPVLDVYCAHMWRPEVNGTCLPLFLSTLRFERGLSLNLEKTFWVDQLTRPLLGPNCLLSWSLDPHSGSH